MIVAQRSAASSVVKSGGVVGRGGDDEGPLSSSSPYGRMELAEAAGAASLLRYPDDRSDSGVSSLRSGSGDERSGSRSSALSSSDEPTTTTTGQHSGAGGQQNSGRNRFVQLDPLNVGHVAKTVQIELQSRGTEQKTLAS